MRSKIIVSEEKLKDLYLSKRLSTYQIGQIFHCNRQTISNNLTRFGIRKHSQSQARIKYHVRRDFNGSLEEKAYLLGFRLGDLNVYKPSVNSETIIIRCHSTAFEQRKLIQSLFKKYGRVTVSKSIYGENINCFLNISFDFLLDKKDEIPAWVLQTKQTQLAFIAGYIDAEGTFQINQGRGRFALSSCDKMILSQIHNLLKSFDIVSIYRKIANKGEKSIGRYNFSNDVWRININTLHSLNIVISLLRPFLKHEKRLRDMLIVLQNLKQREIQKI